MFVLLILPKEALQFLKGQVLFVKGVRVELFTNLWMSVVVRGGGERVGNKEFKGTVPCWAKANGHEVKWRG